MLCVKVELVRFVAPGDSFTGWVECKLVDSRGAEHRFIEKELVVSVVPISPDSRFPQPGVIACQIIETKVQATGKELVVISTELPWGVESTSGVVQFEVLADQLTDV